MRVLQLVNSYDFVLVDDEDWERLSSFRWYKEGKDRFVVRRTQAVRKGKYRTTKHTSIAAEIMQDCESLYDHHDRNPYNNQKNNLRKAGTSQNAINREKWCENSSSKHKGVSFDNRLKRWRASFNFNRETFYLGLFDSEEDAAKAYDLEIVKYHGEFAVLNFPVNKQEFAGNVLP